MVSTQKRRLPYWRKGFPVTHFSSSTGLRGTALITAINGTAFTGTVETSEALNSLTDKIGFNFYYGTIEDIPTSEELLANGLSFDTAAQDGTSHTITTNFTGAAPSIQDSFPAFDTDPGPANNNVLVVQFYVAKNAGTGSEVITFTSAIVPVTSATHGVPTGFSVPPVVGETGMLNNNIVVCPPDSEAVFAWLEDGTPNADTDTQYTAVDADIGFALATRVTVGAGVFTSTATQDVVADIDPAAQAVIDEMIIVGTPPDAAQEDLINDFVVSLKTGAISGNDIWAKCARIYWPAAQDQNSGNIDWKNPGSNALTVSGSVTWAANQGYTGAGGYVDTGFDITSGAPYLQNSAALGVYLRTHNDDLAVIGSSGQLITLRARAALGTVIRVNTVNGGTAGGAIPTGMVAMDRSGSTTTTVYKDGVSEGTNAGAVSVLASQNVWFLGDTVSSFRSTNQISFGFIAGTLTADEHLDLSNAVATYLAGL